MLVGSVLVEMLLFRIFARAGIYIFDDGSPQWAYAIYRAAVWAGTTTFNFAALLALALFVLLAGHLWLRRSTSGRFLPLAAAAMVPWNVVLFFVTPGPVLTLLYLALSAGIVLTAVAASWPRATRSARLALVSLAASFLCVYYFEAIAPLRLAGWLFNDHGIGVFQVGEALAGVGILTAFVAWGRTRSLRLIAAPALVATLLVGGYAAVPERFPLISTWALGVTMSLPFVAYALGAVLLGVTILKLLSSGRPLLGYGLALLSLGHRMLPLTYFNLLILTGFVLLAIALLPDRALSGKMGSSEVEPAR